MIVSEFVEWLKQFPDQEATVEIIIHDKTGDYYSQGGTITVQEFNPFKGHFEYTDLRNNPLCVGKPYANSHTLLIGSTE